MSRIREDNSCLSSSLKPVKNPATARQEFGEVFSVTIPDAPQSHALGEAEQKKFTALWPAGEHAALERLEKFCCESIHQYADNRSEPGADASSHLSVHLSQGTISPRTCVRLARESNSSNNLDEGSPGVVSWVREVGWRDFYRRNRALLEADLRRPCRLASCLQGQMLQGGLRCH
jgi:deoxyribodipyrimidine photo-lyase